MRDGKASQEGSKQESEGQHVESFALRDIEDCEVNGYDQMYVRKTDAD